MVKRSQKSLLRDHKTLLRTLRDYETGEIRMPAKTSHLAQLPGGPRLDTREQLVASIKRRLAQIEAELAERENA